MKFRFGAVMLITLYLPPKYIFSEDGFQKGVILLKNGKTVISEYKWIDENVFLRDKENGKSIPKAEILEIVTEDYYNQIQNSSPLASAGKSILYFNSSSKNQWYGDKGNSGNEDLYVRILKIGLILLTTYFYTEASSANTAVKNSFTGLDSNSANDRFRKNYTAYQAFGAFTVTAITYYAVKAYLRFGRNENFVNLEIEKRNVLPFKEYIEMEKILNKGISQNTFEFVISKRF